MEYFLLYLYDRVGMFSGGAVGFLLVFSCVLLAIFWVATVLAPSSDLEDIGDKKILFKARKYLTITWITLAMLTAIMPTQQFMKNAAAVYITKEIVTSDVAQETGKIVVENLPKAVQKVFDKLLEDDSVVRTDENNKETEQEL